MAIKINSKNIFDYKYKIKQGNEITKVEFSQPKLIKKTGAFGDTKTIALIKARTDAGAMGVFGGVTYTGVTTYTEIYNTDENPYNGKTTVERVPIGLLTLDFYKTSIEFDLSFYLLSSNFLNELSVASDTEIKGSKTISSGEKVKYGVENYTQKQGLDTEADHIKLGNTSFEDNILSMGVVSFRAVVLGDVLELDVSPLSYTLQLYGDYYTVEEEELERSVGDGKDVFLLNSNELTQNNTFYSNTGRTILQEIAKRILERYENGRETVELLCGVGEYYNEDGTLAISTKNENVTFRCFALGHIVTPYIMTSTGEKPLSVNMEGVAKEYRVVGVSLIFDGGVWQKLTLIEN